MEMIRHYESILTVNDADDESEVERINANAGVQAVQVSDSSFTLIQEALAYSQKSEGRFNAAIGPLVKLWNINFDGARKPDQAEIDEVLPLLDYNKIILDEESQTVFLAEAGMRLDLGGIAKGFVADRVHSFLSEQGVESAIIDLGGDLFMLGSNRGGNEWNVGVRNPSLSRSQNPEDLAGTVRVENKAVVTSGVYERYVMVDGVRYHHLLNPETGFPFETGLSSVTVIADRAIDGEGYTKILFGMGVEAALEFVEGIPGIEAILISEDNEIHLSSGLRESFTLRNDDFTLIQ
jgi:thiamine biosynthesis lipoprotein